MSTTIGAKLNDELEADLLPWMDSQPESRSGLIIAALMLLREQRSSGGPPRSIPEPAPIDPDTLAEAFERAAPRIGRAIGRELRSAFQDLAIPIYTNRDEPEPEPEADPDLELAAANFMNTFG